MTEGYVIEGTQPYLPLGCRSGWELLVKLEKYNFNIGGYDMRYEEDIINSCKMFMETLKYKNMAESETIELDKLRKRNDYADEYGLDIKMMKRSEENVKNKVKIMEDMKNGGYL